MRRLGSFVLRRRWWVLIGGLLLAGLAGAYGTGASERLSAGGFNEPGAESSRAARALQDDFRTGPPNVILLVTADTGRSPTPTSWRPGCGSPTSSASSPRSSSPTRSGASPRSRSSATRRQPGRWCSVHPRRRGRGEEGHRGPRRPLHRTFRPRDRRCGWRGRDVPGGVRGGRDRPEEGGADLHTDHAHPARVGLRWVGGRGHAAPGGRLAVDRDPGLVLRIFTAFTDVSVFALNLTTAMGSGWRSTTACSSSRATARSSRAGVDPTTPSVRTMQTAGRTVAFSAMTVAVSLCRAARVPDGVPALLRLRRRRRSSRSPASAPWSCCPRCSPCSAAGSTPLALRHRAPKPVGAGLLAPARDARSCGGRSPSRSVVIVGAAPARRAVPPHPAWACPTTGC